MAVFRREAGRCTSGLPAVWPLRMRVRRSAMGSAMLMQPPSPARLGKARDLAAARDLADLHPRQTELAVHAPRTPGDRAALALARGGCIARLRLQIRLCGRTRLG